MKKDFDDEIIYINESLDGDSVDINTKESKNEKNKDKKKNKKNAIDKWFNVFIAFDVFALICLYVAYGNWDGFRNFWITSAMRTATHQYLAKTLYSDSMIETVISNNFVADITDNTNSSEIVFSDNVDTGVYESVYEEQILKRDEGNDLYKYFSIEINSTTAHVTVVYDSSRIDYALSKYIDYGGQKLKRIAQSENAIIAMNASGFGMIGEKLVPMGAVIKDGKVLFQNGKVGGSMGLIGFNNDNVLVLTKEDPETAIENGMRDAMTFGPFLIVNGKAAQISGNGGWGYAPRSVIAQRKDGIVLFIVFDGRSLDSRAIGASMKDLIEILTRYKAYNAANLDGGGSSTLVINNEVINRVGGWSYSGERSLPDAWIVR